VSEIKITLVKSTNGTIKKQRATVEALGLRKIGQTVIKPDNEAIQGMIESVAHLVETSKA
jgi:large subunit ribosomal protein L30